MTPITVPIFMEDADATLEQVRQAITAGADMVELRADTATPAMLEDVLSKMPPLATIVTVRPTWEGGRSVWSNEQRLELFHTAVRHEAAFIDVELLAWQQDAALREGLRSLLRNSRTKWIVSNHDFERRPADLEKRIETMRQIPEAGVLKIAFKAETVVDGVDALRLTHEHHQRDPRPLLCLAMGEQGQLSRLLAAKFESPLTFATLEGSAGSAPGQPSLRDLKVVYRWDKQRPGTAVFGVVGWPVGHSLSPHIHNAGFAEKQLNAVYVPLPVMPDYASFAAAVEAMRGCPTMNLRGLSVTIPHKENALRYVREHGGTVDELSSHIGVINTIVWREDGTLYGLNSDYAGALDALAHTMGIGREDLRGRRVAVLGAGGAARAIVAGLAHYGANTTIYNRTPERAAELAKDFSGRSGPVAGMGMDMLILSNDEIIINCTPLGMYPKVDGCPIDLDPAWDEKTVVFDTIYNPLKTRLLRLAEAKGSRIVTGLEMFVRQAAVQFEHFTGGPAPVEIFREVMRERLGR